MGKLTDYVVINDRALAAKYETATIPISTLFEAYFDGAVDLRRDIYDLLEARHSFVNYKFTPEHWKYFLTSFVPQVTVHSKKADTKMVRWHYDRGNDFFAAFLGPRMVYTSGYFYDKGQTLEEGQDQKLDLVCRKLKLAPGESMLDIGCGWGTLALHAAKHYGVDATGVTLSEKQAQFANDRIAAAGLSRRARVLCMDYRDIPKRKYDKVSSLEMVEHVGVKNLGKFYDHCYNLLNDNGLFLLQWTGLRRVAKKEDLVWGLFMSEYIFTGADASLPLGKMVAECEKANLEVTSVENISQHYHHTIRKWHDNWVANRDAVVATYGERWYRIWNVFLAWSTIVAAEGSAACFQVLMNKNLNAFDREQWIVSRSHHNLHSGRTHSIDAYDPIGAHNGSVAEAELSARPRAARRPRSPPTSARAVRARSLCRHLSTARPYPRKPLVSAHLRRASMPASPRLNARARAAHVECGSRTNRPKWKPSTDGRRACARFECRTRGGRAVRSDARRRRARTKRARETRSPAASGARDTSVSCQTAFLRRQAGRGCPNVS